MTGTPSQIEWAVLIKPRVHAEFERVVLAFAQVAGRQAEPDRRETQTIIEIVRQKQDETLARDEAGYFIRDWQELRDQVRQMIARDPRFEEIRVSREKRKRDREKGGDQ